MSIISEWIGTENNHSDLFTKNLARNLFEKHTAKFCGNDKYMKTHEDRDSQGEGVGGYKDSG